MSERYGQAGQVHSLLAGQEQRGGQCLSWDQDSSVSKVLGLLFCGMQRLGFDPRLRRISLVAGIFPWS